MKIAHYATDGWQKLLIPVLQDMGHKVLDNKCDTSCDVILVKSIVKMEDAWRMVESYPNIPMVNYNWDVYSWALNHSRPNEYDYATYKELCEQSLEVWVPSRAVQKSLEDFWNMGSRVMKSYFPTKPYNDSGIGDYAFQALRMNPDKHMNWFQKACTELKIPYKMTNPDFPVPERKYRHMLANAKILVSPIHEMSTGGMFLFEGAMWNKPILASNSPYMGAVDYFGDTIAYFQGNSFKDFKDKLLKLYNGETKTNTEGAKKLVENLTVEDFAQRVISRLVEIL